jgi:CheY-like chemotaxis protein
MKLKRILIVEEDKIILDQIRKLLDNKCFVFIEAANGWEGLELAIDQAPDVIISNTDLPKLSEIQLSKEIKNYPFINKLTFCLISTFIINDKLNTILLESEILN